MIWIFEKEEHTAEVEVRSRPTHFEIAVRQTADGAETVHVAHTPGELLAQLELTPRTLMDQGWRHRPADALSLARSVDL
jgi:hypothetical protein